MLEKEKEIKKITCLPTIEMDEDTTEEQRLTKKLVQEERKVVAVGIIPIRANPMHRIPEINKKTY